MQNSPIRRTIFSVFAAFSLATPLLSQAELLPEGLLGMRLGQTRVEAITALVNAGVVPDLDKAQCSENVPEKNKTVANRICKLTIQPGSAYMGMPLNKVSFLFQDEGIVLIGLDVGPSENTYSSLRSTYLARWGEVAKELLEKSASWRDSGEPEGGPKGTTLRLYADTYNAFVVYSYDTVQ